MILQDSNAIFLIIYQCNLHGPYLKKDFIFAEKDLFSCFQVYHHPGGKATHGAIYNRIQKIGKAYEQWADEDLGFRHKEKKPIIDYSKIRQRKGVL